MSNFKSLKTVTDDGKFVVSTIEVMGLSAQVAELLGYAHDKFETAVFNHDAWKAGTNVTDPFAALEVMKTLKTEDMATKYTAGYNTDSEAAAGHDSVVSRYNEGSLTF